MILENKKIGLVLIILSVILVASLITIKVREDELINKIVHDQGSCFLSDGTCLHEDRSIVGYIIGGVLAAAILSLGIYLRFFEKGQAAIFENIENQTKKQEEDERFDILMKGLNEEEKKVINAVREQDGITQQTLRLRTGLHKSKLSIVLSGLEKKDLIKREDTGKTKKVFLKINI